jgi:hypothetical protein
VQNLLDSPILDKPGQFAQDVVCSIISRSGKPAI